MARTYDFDVTLANRRKPWDVTSWADGQTRPLTETYATAAEMLEAAGLADLDVQKRKEWTSDHDNQPIPTGKFSTVDRHGNILGTGLSDRYNVIQLEQAFAFGDAIVDAGGANWERAGKVRGGETAFGCMELSHLEVNVPGDNGGSLKPYLLIVNSFGGWTPFVGIIAFIRPVCLNTFQAAYDTKTKHRFEIRHTGNLDGKLAMAKDALGIATKHTEDVQTLVTRLAEQRLTDKQVAAVIANVWPKGKDSASDDKYSPIAQRVIDQYASSSTLDGIRGTGWGLLNAVTEFIDHVQPYGDKPLTTKQLEQRGLNLILSSGEERKEAVLKQLVTMR